MSIDWKAFANDVATVGNSIRSYDPNISLSADINNKLAIYAMTGAGGSIASSISGDKKIKVGVAAANIKLAQVAMEAAVHNASNGDTDKVLSDISAAAFSGKE